MNRKVSKDLDTCILDRRQTAFPFHHDLKPPIKNNHFQNDSFAKLKCCWLSLFLIQSDNLRFSSSR